ncbi:MAG: hypothetical protein ACLQNE_30715 [Thermoguttaceae bacterium]|jgi:hypothetical protein
MNDQEQQLETILRKRGFAWAIEMFSPSSKAVTRYLETLRHLEEYLKERNRGTISFLPESLEHLLSASPYKADAFLQALVSIRSTPILCAAWRILQGMQVESIDMRYARLSEFTLRVTLRSPYDETEIENYESNDIDDVAFVRHLGKSTVDSRPFFDGFYALRQT